MALHYASGEEIRNGDIVVHLTQMGEFYRFSEAVMKVWDVVKTNDGEVIGVSLVHPSVESPTIFTRRIIRPTDTDPLPEVMLLKDVPGIYFTTDWLVPCHSIKFRLGLVGRMEQFIDTSEKHGELIKQLILQKVVQNKGIFEYYLAEQAYAEREFQQHIDLLLSAVHSGFAPAMCHLALHFFNGTLIEKDHEKCKYWYSQAVKHNDTVAMYQLAGCYARGTGVTQHLQYSFKLIEQAVEGGCWSAIAALAGYRRFGWLNCLLVSDYYSGYGQVDEQVLNHQEALKLYLHIATQAPSEEEKVLIADATYQLGWMYQDGIGTAQDYEQSVYWYRKSAELGNMVAVNNLADKYEHGTGVEQNLEMAAALYSDVADRVVAAALSLGRMYYEGRGVEQNLELAKQHLNTVISVRMSGIEDMQSEAMQLLEKFTADNPLQQVKYILNHPDRFSLDDVQNQIRKIDSMLEISEVKHCFFQLYLLMARKGEASSQSQVGDWYLRGLFTEQNLEEAVYWIQKAVEQKNWYAEYQMGYLYENGLYFNQDLTLANKWYERALRKPEESYCPEYINGQLNPEYLKYYQGMNKDALSGLLRVEQKMPKKSKWKFWQK